MSRFRKPRTSSAVVPVPPLMKDPEAREYNRVVNEKLAKGFSLRAAHAIAKVALKRGREHEDAIYEDAQRQPARNAAAERTGRALLAKYKL